MVAVVRIQVSCAGLLSQCFSKTDVSLKPKDLKMRIQMQMHPHHVHPDVPLGLYTHAYS